MNEEFWQSRWRENQIGFHEHKPNELLVAYFRRLELKENDTIFVPLCGKSVDLDWLVLQGLQVVGIEFNEQAVAEVFARQNQEPEITQTGSLRRYRTESMTLFAGDLFNLQAAHLGDIGGVYDRAALVALEPETRVKYAEHIAAISNKAPQLLITFDYDQELMAGPPFSVPGNEIQALYGSHFQINGVDSRKISGQLSERCHGMEETWHLRPG